MKFDWNLLIGLLGVLLFIVTRWADMSLPNGLGIGCALAGLVILGVSCGVNLAAEKKAPSPRPASTADDRHALVDREACNGPSSLWSRSWRHQS